MNRGIIPGIRIGRKPQRAVACVGFALLWLLLDGGLLSAFAEQETINVQAAKGVLSMSVQLPASDWKDDEGEAQVQIESKDANQKTVPSCPATAAYTIRQGYLQASLSCVQPANDINLGITLTGIKNAKGVSSAKFVGNLYMIGSQGTTGTVVTVPTDSVTPATNPLEPKSSDSTRATLLPIPYIEWAAYLALLMSLVSFFIVLLRRQNGTKPKLKNQPESSQSLRSPERDLKAIGDGNQVSDKKLKKLNDDIEEALETAKKALTTAQKADPQAQLGQQSQKIGKLQTDTEQALKKLQGTIEALQKNVAGIALEFRESARQPQPSTNSGFKAPGKMEEFAGPAIVNQWLVNKNRNRSQLLEMARDLGIQAQLARHRDVDQAFQDLTTFEYAFEIVDDGPWLWVPVPGSGDFWAVPADAVFLRVGGAPALLERLFDGMKDARPDFKLQSIYRACRLSPAAGGGSRYTVAVRGSLQLEDSPYRTETKPPAYETLFGESQPQNRQSQGGGESAGPLLGAWKRSIASQLEGQGSLLQRLSAEVGRLNARLGEPVRDDEARQKVDYLEGFIERKVKDLQSELSRRTQAIPETRPRPVVSEEIAAQPARVPQPAPRLTTSTASAQQDFAIAPVKVVSPATTRVQEPIPQPETPRIIPEPVRPMAQNAPAEAAASFNGELPAGWREVLSRAAATPGSEPEMTALATQAIYVQRCLNLLGELAKVRPLLPVSLVHMAVDSSSRTFEVHATQASEADPAEIACTVCKSCVPWQLAVCLGVVGGGDIRILYPLGSLGRGYFSSGYSLLIEDLPPDSFTVDALYEPAQLQLSGNGANIYSVSRKMKFRASGI